MPAKLLVATLLSLSAGVGGAVAQSGEVSPPQPSAQGTTTTPPPAEECNPACQLKKVKLLPGGGGLGGVAMEYHRFTLPSGQELGVIRPSGVELKAVSPDQQIQLDQIQ